MEIRIGVVYSAKELVIEVDDADGVVKAVDSALADGAAVLWLTDEKGRRVGIPADKLAYVEITTEDQRRVGFGRS